MLFRLTNFLVPDDGQKIFLALTLGCIVFVEKNPDTGLNLLNRVFFPFLQLRQENGICYSVGPPGGSDGLESLINQVLIRKSFLQKRNIPRNFCGVILLIILIILVCGGLMAG